MIDHVRLNEVMIHLDKAYKRETAAREDRIRLERVVREILTEAEICRDNGMESGNGY